MSGIIGKKIAMTSLFDENGKNIPCTIIQAGPCVVTQVRTEEKDGYKSVQLGFDDAKEKNTSAALKGHFKKAGTTPKRKLVEFYGAFVDELELGKEVTVDIFKEGEYVDITGVSKGKGFQGVVKRHGFKGGRRSHGQKHSEREPGSIGGGGRAGGRVAKGMRMAGRMGGDRVTIKNLTVLATDKENGVLLIKLVDQGHHSCNGGVVLQVLKIAADLFDGLVHFSL